MQRLNIVLQVDWEPLSSLRPNEVEFISHKVEKTRPENLGPFIAKRAEWLRLPKKRYDAQYSSKIKKASSSAPVGGNKTARTARTTRTTRTTRSTKTTAPIKTTRTTVTVGDPHEAVRSDPPVSATSAAFANTSSASPPPPPSNAPTSKAQQPRTIRSNPQSTRTTRSSLASSGGDPASNTSAQSPPLAIDETAGDDADEASAAASTSTSAALDADAALGRDCDSPYKEGILGNDLRASRSMDAASSLYGVKAEELSNAFLQEAPHRLCRGLLALKTPADATQAAAVEALTAELKLAIAARGRDDVRLVGIAKTYAAFLEAAEQRLTEDVLAVLWCRVCNHACDFLAHVLDNPEASSTDVAYSTDQDERLFHFTGHRNAARNTALSRDQTKPDIQCLEKARATAGQVHWGPKPDDPGRSVAVTSQEFKRDYGDDLGVKVTGQALRNMYKCFQHRRGLTRAFQVTVARDTVRLWMNDAGSTSVSRAYNASRDEDAQAIAQILALLCSKVDQVAPTWTLRAGMILRCENPAVKPLAGERSSDELLPALQDRRMQIVDEPVFIAPYLARLWGRQTACWSATAVDLDDALQQRFNIIIKAGWLPMYLREHEYQMLRIVHAGSSAAQCPSNVSHSERERESHRDDFPQPLGIVDTADLASTSGVPDPVPTMRLPGVPQKEDDNVEFDTQVRFVVLAQKCDLGLSVFLHSTYSDWTALEHIRILRDLLALLEYVSELGLHYRDVNLGNFALKSNWRKLMAADADASVVMLYDFGNSRYLNHARGGSASPRAAGIRLGADDALSVNALLVSHRVQECQDKLRTAKRTSRNAANEADADERDDLRHDANNLVAQARNLEHRFVDDCESALWAYLILFLYWCRSQGLTSAAQIVDGMCAGLAQSTHKKSLWCSDWETSLVGVKSNLPTAKVRHRAQWMQLLVALNKKILECQQGLPSLNTAEISPKEQLCFRECRRLLNAFINGQPIVVDVQPSAVAVAAQQQPSASA